MMKDTKDLISAVAKSSSEERRPRTIFHELLDSKLPPLINLFSLSEGHNIYKRCPSRNYQRCFSLDFLSRVPRH